MSLVLRDPVRRTGSGGETPQEKGIVNLVHWSVFSQLLPFHQDVNPRFNTIIHRFSYPSSPRE